MRDQETQRRRELRREQPREEIALWRLLRDRRFEGFKFRRQHPCGPYIIDFFCVAAGLAIELDGGQHFEPAAEAYDQRRTAYLRSRGLTVLRFTNRDLACEREGVLETIALTLRQASPQP